MNKIFRFLAMLLIAQIPLNLFAQNLSEGFEGELFPPEDWTVINKGDPNGWERTTDPSRLINGDGSAYILYGATAHNDWLITPRLIPTEENNTISFYAKNYKSDNADLFNVKLSTTGNAEEDFTVVLAENIAAPTTATKYEYDLSAYNGQIVYVAIQAISTNKYYLSLDDFVGPTIFSPALDAAIVSIENTTAYMGNYDIVVTLRNDGTTDLTACDINYSINGTPSTYNWTGTLAKNAHEQVTIVTDYDFTTPDDYIIEATVVLVGDEYLDNNTQVKTVAYYGPFSFPYFEGFEEGNVNGNAITGWSQQSLSGSTSWTANNTETTYNRTPRTGNWNACLKWSNTDWMFTPKRVHLEVGKTYAFAMYARQDQSNDATITVAYGTEPHNSAMVNTIVPSTNITNGNYQEITASFSPAETGLYHLGIKGDIGYYSMYLSIDDISIRIVHTLNYAADANGTIAGEAFQIVDPGANGTAVTAVANTGYHFVKWSDGSTDNPRTDVNVTENMSYTAEFAINTYTITIAAGENGEITPASEQIVEYGSNATFTITPNSGFFIASVLVDNVSVGLLTTYTFNNVTENHTISATFSNVAPTTHAITATAGQNGSILPSGVVPVVENGDITFAISATNGYSIKDVLVDGVSVGNVSSYTFENATAAHTIEAEF
ncbi:MAG: choice-of-anchor J domain-containing protein, partial [Bacteroidales bacterium]|nr:choice-of-anchor J domain-containing protein [Bacteroidales bacterium]